MRAGDELIGLEIYNDVTVGLDDGDTFAGHQYSEGVSIGKRVLGDTYMHYTEKDGNLTDDSHGIQRVTRDIIVNCPNTIKSSSFTVAIFSIDSNGDLKVGSSFSLHAIYGGHVSASFNVSEYFRRRFNIN